MIVAKIRRLLLNQRQQPGRRRIARIAARHQDGVDARQHGKDLPPIPYRLLDRSLRAVCRFHGRIPDPHLEPVAVGNPRHLHHHLGRRQRKMGAVRKIVGDRRNKLDCVRPEDRQFADVLIPHRHRPAVVGVRLGPVAELMSA